MNYNFSGPEEPHKGPTRWEVSVYGQVQEPTQLRGGILGRNHRLLHRRDKEGFHPSLVCLVSPAQRQVFGGRDHGQLLQISMSCFALCALTVKSGELPDVACAMIVHDITLPSLIEHYCAIML